MALNAEVHWIKDIGFEVQVRDHHLFTDGKKESSGGDRGPNPKEYLLSGLIGCTGMDVVSLLKKYKLEFQSFDIKVETELTTDPPPPCIYRYPHQFLFDRINSRSRAL